MLSFAPNRRGAKLVLFSKYATIMDVKCTYVIFVLGHECERYMYIDWMVKMWVKKVVAHWHNGLISMRKPWKFGNICKCIKICLIKRDMKSSFSNSKINSNISTRFQSQHETYQNIPSLHLHHHAIDWRPLEGGCASCYWQDHTHHWIYCKLVEFRVCFNRYPVAEPSWSSSL